MGGAGVVLQKKESRKKEDTLTEGEHSTEGKKQSLPVNKKTKKPPAIKKLTPNAVVQRVKFGQSGVSVCIDDYGEEGPECFTEGTVIYVNRQHPLYRREAQKPDTYLLNVTRLITQEISLMKDTRNPRQAFLRQSKLLRDAFIDRPSV